MVHLTKHIYVRNDLTRYQYIIVPSSHAEEGQHLGEYPDVASAYHAAIKRGAGDVYLHCPNDLPLKMLVYKSHADLAAAERRQNAL